MLNQVPYDKKNVIFAKAEIHLTCNGASARAVTPRLIRDLSFLVLLNLIQHLIKLNEIPGQARNDSFFHGLPRRFFKPPRNDG